MNDYCPGACEKLPEYLRCSDCHARAPKPKFKVGDELTWTRNEANGTFTVSEILRPGAEKYGSTPWGTFAYVGMWAYGAGLTKVREACVLGEDVLRLRWEVVNDPDLRVRNGRIERKVSS